MRQGAQLCNQLGLDSVISDFWLVDFIFHPSAGVLLWSCVVLGGSVSSFLSRNHQLDTHQALVFLLFLVGAIALGQAVTASSNITILVLLPWSLCLAMLVSSCCHFLARRLQGRAFVAKLKRDGTAQESA